MRDKYYAHKRDLIKWGVLLHLAEEYSLQKIIQVAYLRETEWGRLEIDGKECGLPGAVFIISETSATSPASPAIQ